MHIIGSSLCFWISAIVRETVLALTIYAQSLYGQQEDNIIDLKYFAPTGRHILRLRKIQHSYIFILQMTNFYQ